jgi:hypothetical protein
MLHTNVMNERVRGIFIELFARSLGMDGSVMAVSAALALIDAPPITSASTAQLPSSFPPISLLALIEQETLAITTATPQALVASLASKATAAASAASSLSLLATSNNTAIVVKHYIGDVTYTLADIIESNRMTLSASTQTLVASSSNPIVRSCLDAVLSQASLLVFRNRHCHKNIVAYCCMRAKEMSPAPTGSSPQLPGLRRVPRRCLHHFIGSASQTTRPNHRCST